MILTCPTEGNLAAIAKQMHSTALQAEEQIYESEQQMRAAVNLPTVVMINGTVEVLASGTTDIGEFADWDPFFDNTAQTQPGGLPGNFGPHMTGGFTQTLGGGLYEVGLCATLVATGAVTDNSFRQFLIQHNHPDPLAATGAVEVQTTGILLFESNTAVGVESTVVGHFNVEAGDWFTFLISHNNASSLNLNTGAFIWATKISESTLTRVL